MSKKYEIKKLETKGLPEPELEVVINPYNLNMLSAHIIVSYDIAIRYRYVVAGKTEDVNFTYEKETYTVNPVVPVIGLYADQATEVELTLLTETGEEITAVLELDTSGQDYTGHLMNLEIEIYDEAMAESTINHGWLFNNLMDGYDKNGDLRVCGLTGNSGDYITFNTTGDAVYIPSERVFESYSPDYIKYDLLGKELNRYTLPEGTGIHHDLTFDNDGYVYILGNFNIHPEPHKKAESLVYKFVEKTGELVAAQDFTEVYYESYVIQDSPVNDVHFNSITYVPEIDQLIVNSRNSSSYMALDKYTLLPIWNVDNTNKKGLLEQYRNLEVINPDEFVYTNGGHAVFVTDNDKYEAYRGNGRLVLTIFDNVACKSENGDDLWILNEESVQDIDAGYEWDSAVQIVAIDLHKRTIEQLDRLTVPGERSRITSCVYDTDDKKYFQVFYGVEQHFFVMDPEGRVGVAVRGTSAEGLGYRARIISYEELRRLIRD